MERFALFFFSPILLTAAVSLAAESAGVLTVREGRLTLREGRVHAEAPLPADIFRAAAIEGTSFHWLFAADGAGMKYGLEDGLHIFDDQVAFFLRHPAARCDDLALSPDGTIIALAEDSPTDRRWHFYALTHMPPLNAEDSPQTRREKVFALGGAEPLGTVVCPPADALLFWAAGTTGVVHTALESGDYGRTGGDEPRAPRSVAYYDFAAKTGRTLLRGTQRHDYSVVGLDERIVSARKTPAPGALPPSGPPVPFREAVTATIPDPDCPELPVHFALAVEGVFLGINEDDEIMAVVDLAPSTLGASVLLAAAVQDPENYEVFRAMPPKTRVRAVYDMVQQWDARAGEHVVRPVVRKAETTPDNDPKG